MAKVYITGTNGFIGPHLIDCLLERGDDVTGLVRPTADLRALTPLFEKYGNGHFRLVTGDLRQPETLGAGLDGVEIVYHLGAMLMGTTKDEFYETNVDGTRHLLDAVKQHGNGSLRRFVYFSSQAGAGPSPTPQPIDETAIPNPVSWYGKSKRDAEAIVRNYGAEGMPVTIVRPTGVYGEREQLLAESSFPVVKLGLQPKIGLQEKIVCMIYVGDLARGVIAAAESPNAQGKTYFLGDPRPYESRELVEAVADALNKRTRIPIITPIFGLYLAAVAVEWAHHITGNRPLATRDKIRETRQRYWACTPALAKQDFGWEAVTPLKEGMARTVLDWERRREDARRRELGLPRRDRVAQTFTLSFLVGLFEAFLDLLAGGITFGGLARFLGLPGSPSWLIFATIIPVFGITMGFASLWTAHRRLIWQYLAGAAVGVGLELANQLWLHWWEWNPATFGRFPGPILPALILGGGAGLYPLAVNALARVLARIRLRHG